jgi:hypothetical protein
LNHPWFKDIDMIKLEAKVIKPPFKPQIKENTLDTHFFNSSTDQHDLTESVVPQNKLVKVRKQDHQFKDFTQKNTGK